MTKAELVDEIAQKADLTRKHSEVIVDAVFSSIIEALQEGDKIELRGFGSFRVRHRASRRDECWAPRNPVPTGSPIAPRASRTGRNPKTGQGVLVPAKKVPYFKPGKELRELINRG